MTPDFLYSILPSGSFNIEYIFNVVRDYSPHQRAPSPKYDLPDVLAAWYELTRQNRLTILNSNTASKL